MTMENVMIDLVIAGLLVVAIILAVVWHKEDKARREELEDRAAGSAGGRGSGSRTQKK